MMPNKLPEPTTVGAAGFRCRGSRREPVMAQFSRRQQIMSEMRHQFLEEPTAPHPFAKFAVVVYAS